MGRMLSQYRDFMSSSCRNMEVKFDQIPFPFLRPFHVFEEEYSFMEAVTDLISISDSRAFRVCLVLFDLLVMERIRRESQHAQR